MSISDCCLGKYAIVPYLVSGPSVMYEHVWSSDPHVNVYYNVIIYIRSGTEIHGLINTHLNTYPRDTYCWVIFFVNLLELLRRAITQVLIGGGAKYK